MSDEHRSPPRWRIWALIALIIAMIGATMLLPDPATSVDKSEACAALELIHDEHVEFSIYVMLMVMRTQDEYDNAPSGTLAEAKYWGALTAFKEIRNLYQSGLESDDPTDIGLLRAIEEAFERYGCV